MVNNIPFIFSTITQKDTIYIDFCCGKTGRGDCLTIGSLIHKLLIKWAPEAKKLFVFPFFGLTFTKDKNVFCIVNSDRYKKKPLPFPAHFALHLRIDLALPSRHRTKEEISHFPPHSCPVITIKHSMETVQKIFNLGVKQNIQYSLGLNILFNEAGFPSNSLFESTYEMANPTCAHKILPKKGKRSYVALLEKSSKAERSLNTDWIYRLLCEIDRNKSFNTVFVLLFTPQNTEKTWGKKNSSLIPFIDKKILFVVDTKYCKDPDKMAGFLHPDVIDGAICCDSMGYHLVSNIFKYCKKDLKRIILLLGDIDEYRAFGGVKKINWQNTSRILSEKGGTAAQIHPNVVLKKLKEIL